MRTKLNEEDQKQILDSVNALMRLRRKEHTQITPAGDKADNIDEVNNDKHSTITDTVIVSKDYYEEHDSSDESTDESVKSNSVNEDYSDTLERSQNPPLEPPSTRTIVEIDQNIVINDRQTVNNQLSNGDNENVINSKVDEFENTNNNKIYFNTDVSQTCLNNLFESKKINKNNVSIHDNNRHEDSNNVIQNQQHIVEGTIINNMLSSASNLKKYSNQDMTVLQSTSVSVDDDSSNLVQTSKTSRVLDSKGLHSLQIVPDDEDDELSLPTISAITKPDPNKTEELSICFPWKEPCLNEDEFYIKKMSQ